MTITCNRCNQPFPDSCCGGAPYHWRFYECPFCYSMVPNPKWSRLSTLDGKGDRLATTCPGCEEKVLWKQWVFTRLEDGQGQYSCPLCENIWQTG